MILLSLSAAAGAAPYVPSSDEAILERIPAASAARQLAPLREAVARRRRDLASALRLARAYLEISRQTSDPRFVSYAFSTLAPWSNQADAPASVLVLEAIGLQSLHRFDEALTRLDRALELEPRNAQAWLTKAGLLHVRGDFARARAACRALAGAADQLVALTCLAGVDGMSGRLQQSYTVLARLAAQGGQSEALEGWVQGQLGEMAIRLGELAAAEAHLSAAMRSAPDDPYLLAAYADLLLLRNEPKEAIALLRAHEAQDALLLRLAIAGRTSGAPETARWTGMLDARRRAVRADDNPHLREHARFALDVLARPAEALELARSNWAVQREPADIALYARAARAAGSASDERAVLEWIRKTGYEDRALGGIAEPRIAPSRSRNASTKAEADATKIGLAQTELDFASTKADLARAKVEGAVKEVRL